MQKNELVKNKDPFSRNRLLKRITITAVFVALACVTSLIAGFRLPLFGRRRHARQFERYFFFVPGYFVWPGLRGGVLRVYGFVRLYCEAVGRL